MNRPASWILGLVLVPFAACTASQDPGVSGRSDTTTADATTADATTGDAASPDAGGPDATNPDGGEPPAQGEIAMDAPVPRAQINLGRVVATNDGEQAMFVASRRAIRVRPDGTVVDTVPIRLPGGEAVAYDGAKFVVAWGYFGGVPSDSEVRVARLTREGIVLDPEGIRVAPASGAVTSMVAGRDGERALVGWVGPSSGPGGWSFKSVPVFDDGTSGPVTDYGGGSPPQFNIETSNPALAAGSATCQFNGVSNGGQLINGISDCGFPLGPINGSPSDAKRPAMAENGSFLSWLRASDNTVHAGGLALAGKGTSLAVGFDGSVYHVVWATDSSPKVLVEQRLTPNKTLIDPTPIPIASGIYDGFAVTCPGTTCMVGFADENGVAAARLASGDTGVGPRIPLYSAPNNETMPRAAAGPNGGHIVVWQDDRLPDYPLYAVRVGANGRVLDANAIHVADKVEAFNVSATSTQYVIAVPPPRYVPNDPLRIIRIDAATGTVLDTPPAPSQGSSNDVPGVACGPSECLVTWAGWAHDTDGGPDQPVILGRRIDAQGSPVGPSSFVVGAGFSHSTIARNDAGIYLVGWRKSAARVDGATGSVLDPVPLSFTFDDGEVNASASNGTDFLVTFNAGKRAARVTADGRVLDPTGFPVQNTPAFSSLSTLTGDAYFMTWEESRDGTCGIYGAIIGTDGSITPPNGAAYATEACQPVPLGASRPWPTRPSLASHRDGKAFLAFQRRDGSDRVRALSLAPGRKADVE
ncbi:hypothetical protein LVJ94_24885 [Pendulispora rubella]|uniref:Uncharacterized protein n=1 Tax=Pendulispora rubella TaxID=2741070 RepID=A0ABZ2LMQ2_9BACT